MHFPRVRLDLLTHHPHMALTTSFLQIKKSSNIFSSRSASSILVCRWWWWWWYCSLFFFLLSFSSPNLTFSAASEVTVPITLTDTTAISPPVRLNTLSNHTHGHSHNHSKRHKLIIIVSTISFFLLLMGVFSFFKCFRFQNRRISKRVENALDESHLPITITTQVPDPKWMAQHPQQLSWEVIEQLGMKSLNVVGQGGFSTVYLARFSDSSTGALKVINRNSSERLNRLFKQELEILFQLGRHEHIVNFLGFCDEQDKDGVLLFEYVSNGSLHDKLHQLSWRSRMKIAFQLGQAIEYLHDKCALQIVHGDIKASNVLLDDQLNCKLCDFGFAKMGFSSSVLITPCSSSIMGSPGYMDPHYLRTGVASKKNDVYSFGVVILELITGIEAFCSEKEQFLTSILGTRLTDPTKVAEMVDLEMGDFNAEEGRVMACIAAQCLKQQPSLRPSMADILKMMRDKIPTIEFGGTIKAEEKTTH